VTLFPTHSPRLQFCLPQTHSWPAGKQTEIKVETPGQLCADTRLVFSFATSAAAVQKPRNKMQLIPRTELLEPLEPWNPETLRSLLPSPHWLYQILFNCRLGSVFGVRCSVLSMQSSSQTWILQHCKRFCCIGILSTAWAPVLEILLCQRQMPLHSIHLDGWMDGWLFPFPFLILTLIPIRILILILILQPLLHLLGELFAL